jgi:uncharacterized protein with HEPN domain
MPRELAMYYAEILRACDDIVSFVGNMTLPEYSSNALVRAGVERKFEIIGEALRHAIELEPLLEAKITDARLIVKFRNVLIHGYYLVDDTIVWDVIQTKLGILRQQIEHVKRTTT